MEVDEVYQVKLYTSALGQVGINVMHYRVTAKTGVGASLQSFVSAVEAAFAPVVKACLYNAARWEGALAVRVLPLPPTTPATSSASAGIGTAGINPLPSQVSGIITKRTAFAGRKYRGRFYVSFPSTSDLAAAETPTPGYVTRLDAIGSKIILAQTVGVAPNQNTLIPVVFHRAAGTSDLIVSTVSRTKWATQRRRGDYGRANAVPVL